MKLTKTVGIFSLSIFLSSFLIQIGHALNSEPIPFEQETRLLLYLLVVATVLGSGITIYFANRLRKRLEQA